MSSKQFQKLHIEIYSPIASVLQFIPTLLVLMLLLFLLMQQIPGPQFGGENSLDAQVENQLRQQNLFDSQGHLDFWQYAGRLLQGDFGQSLSHPGQSVLSLLLSASKWTFALACFSFLIALVVSYLLVVFSRYKKGLALSLVDLLVMVLSSVPLFCLAPLVIWLVAVKLDLFPLIFDGSFLSWCLPIFLLAIKPTMTLSRHLSERMDEQMYAVDNQWLRALGFSELKIVGYFSYLKSCSGYFSQMSLVFIQLLSGSFFIENIYSIAGLGRLTFEGVLHRDWTLLMGITLWIGVLVLLVHLLIDLFLDWVGGTRE